MTSTTVVPIGSAVGLHWLIDELQLKVPSPAVRSEIAGSRRTVVRDGILEQYPRLYKPKDLLGHIRFALRYEPVCLDVYKAAFKAIEPSLIQRWIQEEPTGRFARRAWYLYEGLTGQTLDIPDLKVGTYVDLLDYRIHVVGFSKQVKRQRVNDNMLGDFTYSPLIRRSETLEHFHKLELASDAKKLIESIDPFVLMRAVKYLYTSETKSSFAIEGETPSEDRTERFVVVLRKAGEFDSTEKQSFVELQNLIVDPRYAQKDWRINQNYVGSVSGTTIRMFITFARGPRMFLNSCTA